MKKFILGFATLLALVAFSTTTLVAEDSKCGEGKCGTSQPDTKCGAGKCGGK